MEDKEIYVLKDGDCNEFGAYDALWAMYEDFKKYYASQYPLITNFLPSSSELTDEEVLKFFSDNDFLVEVYILHEYR